MGNSQEGAKARRPAKLSEFSIAAALSVVLAFACSSSSPAGAPAAPPSATPDAGADAADATLSDAAPDSPDDADAAPIACGKGSVPGPDGACMPVGIQTCADAFWGDDGLCRPRSEACPPGTRADVAKGCVAVGIPNCAPAFVVDGFCRAPASACPDGTFPVPSEGCVSIDGPSGCGAGPWGDATLPDGTIHVDASAPAGGDGSAQKPFSTLKDALAAAHNGGTIAIAAGTYAEPIVPKASVSIRGRCASMVRFTGTVTTPEDDAIAYAGTSAKVSIAGVELSGNAQGLVSDGLGEVSLSYVRIRATRLAGVFVLGGKAKLDHVVVEDTAPVSGDFGQGLYAAEGAVVTATASLFARNVGANVFGDGAGTSISIGASVLEGAASSTTAELGTGVNASGGSSIEVDGSFVADNGVGIATTDAGSKAIVTDSVIAGNVPSSVDGRGGMGVHAIDGAAVDISSSALLDNHGAAISVLGAGASGKVDGCLGRGTLTDAKGNNGHGLYVQEGATLDVTSSTFDGNAAAGVVVDTSSVATLATSLVEGTLPDSTGHAGIGITVQNGGKLTLTDSAIVGNRDMGVSVIGAGELAMSRNLVEGTDGETIDGANGLGVTAEALPMEPPPKLGLDGDAIVGNRFLGLSVLNAGAVVDAKGVYVAGTLPERGSGRWGAGVGAIGGSLHLAGSVVRNSATVGVLVLAAAGTLEAEDVVVDGVAPGLADITSTPSPLGDGVLVTFGATADVARARVVGCARAGLLFDGASGKVDATTSTGNAYGIVLQHAPKPELGTTDSFDGNSTENVVSDGSLPVPDALTPPTLPKG